MKARITPQAQAVLGVLSSTPCHLSAEEILNRLEGVGTATVYRALDHLAELGLVRRLSLGKKSSVYECYRGEHGHFVCRQCGGVFDVNADFSGMIREAAQCCGHMAQACEVTAFGICKACQAQGHAAQEASASPVAMKSASSNNINNIKGGTAQ